MSTDNISGNRINTSGGAATGGGINFQAATIAIAYLYMARGQQLSWLNDLVADIPVSVATETGGSGDDIRILLGSGDVIEAQVKKGLQKGSRLWEPLVDMAKGCSRGEINYGVLIVCPNSSGTIRNHLAKDLLRIGGNRFDGLSDIAQEFVNKIKLLDLPVVEVCKRLRVLTINAAIGNCADIRAAKSEFSHLVNSVDDVDRGWSELYTDATRLIEIRGQRDLTSVLNLLKAKGIDIVEDDSQPMAFLNKLVKWTYETNSFFSILGTKNKLNIDKYWIPLRVVQKQEEECSSLQKKLKIIKTGILDHWIGLSMLWIQKRLPVFTSELCLLGDRVWEKVRC